MQSLARKVGKHVRPHCKTSKCSKVAALQLDAGACGVCVTTLHEAFRFVGAGIRKILITSEITGALQCAAVARLRSCFSDSDDELIVVIDSLASAEAMNAELKEQLDFLVNVEVGQLRTGCRPEDAEELVKKIKKSCPNLRLRGVQAYAGHIQHIHSRSDRREKSLQALKIGEGVFDELKILDPSIDILTGAGTGTFDTALQESRFTDIQPGSYIALDAEYLAIDGFGGDERWTALSNRRPPLTLLTQVVHVHERHVTCDAGLKSLYQDGPGPIVLTEGLEGAKYSHQGDEHGKIILPDNCPTMSLGDKIEMTVSHCDPTVSLHDRFFVVNDENEVVDVFPIDARGHGDFSLPGKK